MALSRTVTDNGLWADLRRQAKWPFVGVLLALLSALIASTGNLLLVISFVAMGMGLALLQSPKLLIYLAMLTSMVFVGTAEVFLNFQQANWAASGVVSGLVLACLISKPTKIQKSQGSISYKLLMGGFFLYIATTLMSLLLNTPNLGQTIAGLRNYWPFIGVFLVLALGRIPLTTIKRLSILLIFIASIQGLYAVAQQLIIVPKRHVVLGSISGDVEAIVGTFGGNPLMGGYTGEMASFMAVMAVCTTFLAIRGSLPKWVPYIIGASFLVAVGLAETKIVFILLPLATAALLFKIPGGFDPRLLKPLIAGAFFIFVFAAIYWIKYWEDPGDFLHAFTYSFDPEFMVTESERGRMGSLIYWWDSVIVEGNVQSALFGFGPAASTASSTIGGVGSAVLMFGLGLDNNAVTKILWDFGFFGLLGVLLMIAGAYGTLINTTNDDSIDDSLRSILLGCKCFVAMFLLMLPYQVSIFGGAPMQYIFWLVLGVTAYAARFEATPTRRRNLL